MEGIPVTRCVQNPGQYVILFPGSCYSAVNCGFNCLEKANFAPIDWLPHGDVAVHQNQEKKKKSLISYDKILLGAAREAVKHLKEYSLSKKKTADNMRWLNACGREGLFTSIVKVCSLPLLCLSWASHEILGYSRFSKGFNNFFIYFFTNLVVYFYVIFFKSLRQWPMPSLCLGSCEELAYCLFALLSFLM